MFWFEMYMGVLKRFVCQRARPKGSMVEGWLLHKCMYYIVEYLQCVDDEAPPSWTVDESSKESTKMICGKGAPLKLTIEERESLSTLVIYNLKCMQKWI